jgi:protein-S-isoprenylcysteine O-methyltransferase Ste14
MLRFIPLLELPVLIAMVLVRAVMLRRHGIKAIVFGKTDKSDYFIIPVVLLLFYSLLASVFNLPFPGILVKPLFEGQVLYITAIAVCTASLVWFGITLKIFGKSFRVGIDENTKDKLIAGGTFALSRNPIYVGFIAFFTGLLIAYSNIAVLVFLVLLVSVIHRQIIREEVFLKVHYGTEYEEYCKKVRRYI